MSKHSITLIISFICFSHSILFSQTESSFLRLKFYNAKKPLCKINDLPTFKVNDTTLKLSPGQYNVKIWMPTTSLIDTTIILKSNDSSTYTFKIKYTPEFSKHMSDYSRYKFLQSKRYFLPPIYIGASIGAGLLSHSIALKRARLALIDRAEYSGASSQSAMDAAEKSFIQNKKDYKKFINIEIGMYALAGVFTANYLRLLIKQKRTKTPVYHEEKLLSKIKFNAYPVVAEKKWMVGLSMNF